MAIVTIVGAGMMGTALCWPLIDNRHTVRLVGTPLDEQIIQSIRSNGIHPRLERAVPPGIQTYQVGELAHAVKGADLLISGVSSFGTDWFIDTVGPLLQPGVPVLAVTKGLNLLPDGDLQPLPEYINERLPSHLQGKISLNAIAGPCIAHELAARRQTCVVFCGKDAQILTAIRTLFATTYYHISTSLDMKEIEICAALKNGYALAVGMAIGQYDAAGDDGLAKMYNPQAALFAQSCLEMSLLLRALGINDRHVSWLPGAGDLYVTVYGGRTRRLGRLLGQGYSTRDALKQLADVTLESVEVITRVASALPRLAQRSLLNPLQFPLLRMLDDVLNKNEPVDFAWHEFFQPLPD